VLLDSGIGIAKTILAASVAGLRHSFFQRHFRWQVLRGSGIYSCSKAILEVCVVRLWHVLLPGQFQRQLLSDSVVDSCQGNSGGMCCGAQERYKVGVARGFRACVIRLGLGIDFFTKAIWR
jgi:hypothetical protein